MTEEDPHSDISRLVAQLTESFTLALLQIQTQWQSTMKAVVEQVEESWRPYISMLAAAPEFFKQLPGELRPGILEMAKRGWYISAEMSIPELRELCNLAEAGKWERLDSMMQIWIEQEIQGITLRACTRFPRRKKILKDVMVAHTERKYSLSVPVLLIQTEGMCIDTFEGKKLFQTKDGVPVIGDYIKQYADSPLSEVFLFPLQVQLGLTATEGIRAQFPEAPNRHEIIHGIDIEYPIEITSQKVISLMEYFVTVVVPPDREKPVCC